MPEFGQHSLEVLRQPLEDRTVTISRAQGSLTFPANFMLVGAQNPCPCGFYGDTEHGCTCSPMLISRYHAARADLRPVARSHRHPRGGAARAVPETRRRAPRRAVSGHPGAGGSCAGAALDPVCRREGWARRQSDHQRRIATTRGGPPNASTYATRRSPVPPPWWRSCGLARGTTRPSSSIPAKRSNSGTSSTCRLGDTCHAHYR